MLNTRCMQIRNLFDMGLWDLQFFFRRLIQLLHAVKLFSSLCVCVLRSQKKNTYKKQRRKFTFCAFFISSYFIFIRLYWIFTKKVLHADETWRNWEKCKLDFSIHFSSFFIQKKIFIYDPHGERTLFVLQIFFLARLLMI